MSVIRNCFRTIFAIAFTIGVLPFYLLFAMFFVVYRMCVDFVLRKKLGEKYGELLCGADQFFAPQQEVANSVVNGLFIVESTSNNFPTIVKDTFKSRFFEAPERLAKFTGVCKKAFGYYYVVKDEYSADECVREVQDEVKDIQHLKEIFNKYASLPLPKNRTTFWEVLVFKNSIKWNDSKNCFPIMLRFNHSISDGVNLFYALFKFLNDDPIIHQSKPIVSKPTKLRKVFMGLKNILFNAYIMIKMPWFLLFQALSGEADSTALTIKTMAKKANLTWMIEDGEIITKIKKIKNAIPQTTFTDVLITALSATFEEYFAKNGLDVPENFTILYPMSFNPPETFEKPPVLFNNFAGVFLSTPIRWNSSIIDKLKAVKRRQAIAKGNYGIYLSYWMFCVLPHYLPPVVMKIFSGDPFTLAFSNVPSPPYATMFGGQLVDIISCTSLVGQSGMAIIFLNYGGERMQLCFSVDNELNISADGMNDILSGIGKYVNVMYQELNLNSGKF